ncbi:bifunctional methylenetetrahydrofolate dehydrogenase/methenyltetrahydrofolate cyclohydrolase FolD [Buchnera aphidicola (Kurisakia onigurumii)]|uniref:bifunctional methylenetetrahydrofolate dehydrogenase/methenyltetrahydrofolate cyclohydrolase FolD n=1 Tax=Buchnera aphidicola TaxID=9 RepID=UPI0031B670E7
MKKKIIDGNKISQKIRKKIKKKLQKLIINRNRKPSIVVLLVGNDPSSIIYVKNKKQACKEIGITSRILKFKETIQEKELINIIHTLNNDTSVDAILIQLPLPKNISIKKIFNSISPKKDVDGFHPYNIGCLLQKTPKLRPCTPQGIMMILKKYKIKTHGLNAVILGASNIVGRPMSLELLLAGCTTTVTHRFTKNLYNHTKKADLLIVAIGKPKFINNLYIKKGAIVIDAGINKDKNGRIVGDVDIQSAIHNSSLITPVPGGVGPMTITALLKNTIQIYEKNKEIINYL